MPKIAIHQSNFSGGYLTPGFRARSDLQAFRNGLQTFSNWANLVPGGMARRPGTRFRYSFGLTPTRIIEFAFNEAQRYIIGLQASQFLVIDPTDWSLITTVTGCPWTEAQLWELRYTQRADALIICHQSFHPQLIKRTSATTYTIEDFPWEFDISGWPKASPQYKIAGPSVTLTPSAITGSINLTTSIDWWTSDHVGVIVEYRGKQIEITAITSATVAVGTVRQELDEAYSLNVTNADDFQVGETLYGKDSFARAEVVELDSGGLQIRVNMLSGEFNDGEEVEGLTSGTVGELNALLYGTAIAPLASAEWTEEAFSAAQGYPKACVFHGGRLWFGGSTSLPAHLFGSRAQGFFNFDVGEAFPADAISDLIAADNVHQIEHLHSGRQLQIFTDQGAFYAPESENRPLTPEDFLLRRISWYGSNQARPAQHEASTLMAQDDSPLVREILWNELQQNFDHDAINYQAATLTTDTKEVIVADSVSGEVEPYAMFLQDDGSIAIWTGVRREEISAWACWKTRDNDAFYSLANLDGKIIAVAKRDVLNDPYYYLEEFDFTVAMDCVVASDVLGSAGSAFTGLTELGSENVSIIAPQSGDQWYLGDADLSAGEVDVSTLTQETFTGILAGFNYTGRAQPMPVAEQLPDGPLRGRRHRIVSATLILQDSIDFTLTGSRFVAQNTNSDPSVPPAPVSGYRRFHMFGWGQEQSLEIVSAIPLPTRVLGLTYEVAF